MPQLIKTEIPDHQNIVDILKAGNFEGKTVIDKVLDDILSQQILIPKYSEVHHYLFEYSDLLDILLNLCYKMRKHFDLATELSLELFRSQEAEDYYLTLYVRQPTYNKNLLSQIDEVYSEFEEMLADKQGYILATTDFQPVRINNGV